jgi:F-type H+-transporting ATPase subunit b
MAEKLASEPMIVLVEVVQFLLLAVIFYVVAFGFGKRKGVIINALDRNADRVAADLERIEVAPRRLAEAETEAERIRADAAAEADRIVREAGEQAATLVAESRQQIDAEVAAIIEGARGALETEFAEAQAEIRDTLIGIVAEATRSVMNERLSLPEQRDLIERSILESIESGRVPTGVS